MSQGGEMRDWKERIKEMHQSPINDSLELGDSWKAIPRRTEMIGNKPNGLYRRSALPPLSVKNIYNIIIEKQPKPTVDRQTTSDSTNEAAAVQSPKTQIPTVSTIPPVTPQETDSFNFSKFSSLKNNGEKCITSTPFPPRPNQSPTRINVGIQSRTLESSNKNHLRLPSQIPISTPRTSRVPSHHSHGQSVQFKRLNSDSHPVVSSTVEANDDEEDCVIHEPSQKPQEEVCLNPPSLQNQRVSHTIDNIDQDDDQEPDVFAKPPSGALFLRPRTVLQPSQNRKESDVLIGPEIEPPPENTSTKSTISQRGRKPKPKVNEMLENYMKLGETIRNRTNSMQSQSSTSSSTRRKLYKKGDSCNEDEIVHTTEPSTQIPSQLNSLSSNDVVKLNGAGGLFGSEMTTNERNHDVFVKPTRTTESQRDTILDTMRSANQSEHNDIADPLNYSGIELETQTETRNSNSTNKLPNVSRLAGSTNQQENIEENVSDDESFHQPTIRGGHNFREDILDDWSDTSTVVFSKHDDDDNFDDPNDLHEPIHESNEKQPQEESRVRQARSKSPINEDKNVPPSKKTRSRYVQSNKEYVDAVEKDHSEDEEDEDELMPQAKSKEVGSNKQKIVRVNSDTNKIAPVINKRNEKKPSKVEKPKPIQTSQQREDVDNDFTVRNEIEPRIDEVEQKKRSKQSKKKPVRSTQQQQVDSEDDLSDENKPQIDEAEKRKSKTQPVRVRQKRGVEKVFNTIDDKKKRPKKSKIKRGQQQVEINDEFSDSNEVETDKKKKSQKTVNVEVVAPSENKLQIESQPPTTSKSRGKAARTKYQPVNNEDEDVVQQTDSKEIEIQIAESEAKQPTSKSRGRAARTKDQPVNNEDEDVVQQTDSKEIEIQIAESEAKQPTSKSRGRAARTKDQPVNNEDEDVVQQTDSNEIDIQIAEGEAKQPPKQSRNKPVRSKNQRVNNEDEDVQPSESIEIQVAESEAKQPTSKSRGRAARTKDQPVNNEDVVQQTDSNEIEIQIAESEAKQPTSKSRGRAARTKDHEDEDVVQQNDSNEIEIQIAEGEATQPPKQSRNKPVRSKNQRVNNEHVVQPSTSTRSKKNPVNNEVESEEEETELPKKSKVKKAKKLLNNNSDDVMETNIVDQPPSESGELWSDDQPGSSTNVSKPSKKTQKRQPPSRIRELDTVNESETGATSQPIDESDNQSSQMSNSKESKKTKKRYLTKWEMPSKSQYNAMQPREIAPGLRHSKRPRRLPENNLLLSFPRSPQKRKALSRVENASSKRIRSNESGHVETVYSMILNGTIGNIPPLVNNLNAIEITNGFYTTTQNKLVIHHIPGDAGPSYGYLTLEPGVVKRACRISWSLHIHVITGPVIITNNGDSQTMNTGSFAILPIGTKYSLRNDGENTALLFFNQQQQESSPENSANSV